MSAVISGFFSVFEFFPLLFVIGFLLLMIVSMWRIFEKAGKPGWACIIPIYNFIVFVEIAKKPGWWVILMLIPYIGMIWHIWATNMLVKNFGKDEGFTVGCVLLPFVFYPILAFGDAKYIDMQEQYSDHNILDSNVV